MTESTAAASHMHIHPGLDFLQTRVVQGEFIVHSGVTWGGKFILLGFKGVVQDKKFVFKLYI